MRGPDASCLCLGVSSLTGPSTALVAGAGIVGLCCALSLQRAGLKVTLIDRAAPGEACSLGNSGSFGVGLVAPHAMPGIGRRIPRLWLRPDEPLSIRLRHLPHIIPWGRRFLAASKPESVRQITAHRYALLSHALPAWDELIAGNAQDLIRAAGMLFVFGTAEGPQRLSAMLALARSHGVRVEPLPVQEAQRINPALSDHVKFALLFPDNRHTVNPLALTQRLALRFVADGGVIRRASVQAVEAGAKLRLEGGEVLDADAVVLACGAWTPSLLRPLHVSLPLVAERGYHVMTPLPEGISVPTTLSDRNVVLTPMQHGLRITGVSELGGPDDPPRWKHAYRLIRLTAPFLREPLRAAESVWSGPRPSTPDSMPAIGPIPGQSGLYVAAGHGQAGLAMAAVTGRLMAELVVGRAPLLDPTPYRIERFAASSAATRQGDSAWARA